MVDNIQFVVVVVTFILVAAVHFRDNVDRRKWRMEWVIGAGRQIRYHRPFGYWRQVHKPPTNITDMSEYLLRKSGEKGEAPSQYPSSST